jgi:large subunit ribosomal protein L33
MAKGKKNAARQVIHLECTESRAIGASPSRYTTTKNKKNTTGRLELRKYNKFLRRVTLHREIK